MAVLRTLHVKSLLPSSRIPSVTIAQLLQPTGTSTLYKYPQKLTQYHQHLPLFIAILTPSTLLHLLSPFCSCSHEDPYQEQVSTSCSTHHDPRPACRSRYLSTETSLKAANQRSVHCRSQRRSPCHSRVVASGKRIFYFCHYDLTYLLVELPHWDT